MSELSPNEAAHLGALDLPGDGTARDLLRELDNGMCRLLAHCIEHRSPPRGTKTSGYTVVEIPEWLMRQWIERIRLIDTAIICTPTPEPKL